MNFAALNIRRATVDDLPALKLLWEIAQLPVEILESRLTEFQIVEQNGILVGAIGLQIQRTAMRLHSEDYTDFSLADAARELFWQRIQTLAANHGIFRIWTLETSPFWKQLGFQPAKAETLERQPDEWKNLEGNWLTLELKDEAAIQSALGNNFSDFMDCEKAKTERLAASAKKVQLFIIISGFSVGIIGCALALYLFIHRQPFAP